MGDDFRFQELGNVDQSAEKDDRNDILDETFSAGIWTVDSLNAQKKEFFRKSLAQQIVWVAILKEQYNRCEKIR